jgi:ABC-2 type transport system ATP-binding protein
VLEIEGLRLAGARGRAGPTIDLETARAVTVIGPAGSGKSRLARTIATLEAPAAGRLALDGRDLVADPLGARRRLAYVGAELALPGELDLGEYLALAARLGGLGPRRALEAAAEAAAAVHLETVLGRRLGQLSGGMKRRALIAQALVRTPRLLVLDAPTAGLDPREQIAVYAVVRRLAAAGTIVVVATAQVADAEGLAFPLAVLVGGTVVAQGEARALAAAARGHVLRTARRPRGEAARAGICRPERHEGERRWRVVGEAPGLEATAVADDEVDLTDGVLYALWRAGGACAGAATVDGAGGGGPA